MVFLRPGHPLESEGYDPTKANWYLTVSFIPVEPLANRWGMRASQPALNRLATWLMRSPAGVFGNRTRSGRSASRVIKKYAVQHANAQVETRPKQGPGFPPVRA